MGQSMKHVTYKYISDFDEDISDKDAVKCAIEIMSQDRNYDDDNINVATDAQLIESMHAYTKKAGQRIQDFAKGCGCELPEIVLTNILCELKNMYNIDPRFITFTGNDEN